MDELKNIPRGRPKSGRVWKSQKTRVCQKLKLSNNRENRKAFSQKCMDKTLKTSWETKMKQRAEKKAIKAYEKEIKAERKRRLEEQRLKTEEKKKRQLENSRKSEIVQPIKNTAKIKRMKKKQLRLIEKR